MKYLKEEIKTKLKKEFSFLEKQKKELNKKIGAVIILAAEEIDLKGKNRERIDEGLKIISVLCNKPLLIYLGTQNHNKSASIYLKSKDITFKLIESHSQANTKDQIVDLQKYFKKSPVKTIIIASHIYHIPRIKRYCRMIIPKVNVMFWKIGKITDFKKEAAEEIEKIIEYSKKGDLPLFV